MIIETIKLCNFGSYEGETVLDTRPANERTIILIGGKNGAGKTTLFSAMRICLYGYMSMGYRNKNAYYLRAILKLINNTAKLSKPVLSFVEMQIKMNNGRDNDTYVLRREWAYDESVSESFSVTKNGARLDDDDLADFEKFLLSIIPPDLFNLYFFDGERIADFFLDEGSNARIRSAFLTISGYDVFDLMRKNFKRIGSSSQKTTPHLEEYLVAKDHLAERQQEYQQQLSQLERCLYEIDGTDATLSALEKDYYQKGGITQEEWNQKLFTLKDEEKKRETYNAVLKKWANEIVPFIMIREQIAELKLQIEQENRGLKYRHFCELVDALTPYVLPIEQRDSLKLAAASLTGEQSEPILGLSIEQSALVLGQLGHILDFDPDQIKRLKKRITRSLSLTASVRAELDNSSVSTVQEYMRRKAELFEQKSTLLTQRVELEKGVSACKEAITNAESTLLRAQSTLEEELKKASISDISARAIIMLDKLQQSLYQKQIRRLEQYFRAEIQRLLRKKDFIEGIWIDDTFNIHPYRTDVFTSDQIKEILENNTEEQLNAAIGVKAVQELLKQSGSNTFGEAVCYYRMLPEIQLSLPVEIDKTSLSNGEKQIFIMALYHSLVRLCSLEIPFVIDTPFARIDTEHRRNISKHFFSELDGQVFILSTNEEIDSDHVMILKDKIAATYLLENIDNKKTQVVRNTYFEV